MFLGGRDAYRRFGAHPPLLGEGMLGGRGRGWVVLRGWLGLASSVDDVPSGGGGDGEERYSCGEEFEVAADEGFDFLSEEEYEESDCAEACAASDGGGDEEFSSVHVPDACCDGEYFVGYGCEGGDEDGPCSVAFEELVDACDLVFAEHA